MTSHISGSPRPRRRHPWRAIRAIALLVVAAVVLAACGSADDSIDMAESDFGYEVPAAEPVPGIVESRDMAVDGSAGTTSMPEPVPPGAPTGRHVIRSADMAITVSDTARGLEQVIDIAERAGGYAATTDLTRDREGILIGWVALRVPADRLDRVVRDIEGIAESVQHSRTDEQDVTMEIVDVEARLDNLETFEQELLALLGEVREREADAEGLLQVFERIRQVRQEIDMLTARQTALRDQVDMSTVYVGLQQTRTASDVSWSPAQTLRDAVAATARLLTQVADGVIWAVVTVLPIVIAVLAIPAVVAGVWWRRRAARRATPSVPASE